MDSLQLEISLFVVFFIIIFVYLKVKEKQKILKDVVTNAVTSALLLVAGIVAVAYAIDQSVFKGQYIGEIDKLTLYGTLTLGGLVSIAHVWEFLTAKPEKTEEFESRLSALERESAKPKSQKRR